MLLHLTSDLQGSFTQQPIDDNLTLVHRVEILLPLVLLPEPKTPSPCWEEQGGKPKQFIVLTSPNKRQGAANKH